MSAIVFFVLLTITSVSAAAEKKTFDSSQIAGVWAHQLSHPNGKQSNQKLEAKLNKSGERIFELSKHAYPSEPVFVGWAVYSGQIEVYFKLKANSETGKKIPYCLKYVLANSESGLKGKLYHSWSDEQTVTLNKTAEAVSEPAKQTEPLPEVRGNGVKEKGKFVLGRACPPIRFKSVNNRPVRLDDMKGKVVLVDFWATWCGPCVKEMPTVIQAYEELHDDGFEIIGISLDKESGKLRKFVSDNKMAWEQFFDGKGWNNKFATFYGVRSVPTTILVDKKGVVRYINMRGESMISAIKVLLAE
ncbi:MAG: TlpA family protein disulfide reductase [Anaerohalosphaera sp.]|nr:TlpA family protein disulfide reductase [Anaerohalosphaera sp.]